MKERIPIRRKKSDVLVGTEKFLNDVNKGLIAEILTRKLKNQMAAETHSKMNMETRAKLAFVDSVSNFKNLKRIFNKASTFDGYNYVFEKLKAAPD